MTALPEICSVAGEAADEQLMEMIQCGSMLGLGTLHSRYANMLRGVSMAILHNSADSEDLVQEVFVEIWNRATLYNPCKGRPLPWIVTMTRRRSIDRLRKRECYNRFEDRFAAETECLGESWSHVYEDVSHSEQNAHLRHAMNHLPEAQRAVIQLAFHEQMTQREIASKTGIPLGTIKTRLQLGLRKLAVTLSALGDFTAASTPTRCCQKNNSLRDTTRLAARTI